MKSLVDLCRTLDKTDNLDDINLCVEIFQEFNQ
jgi:hypothetical protein